MLYDWIDDEKSFTNDEKSTKCCRPEDIETSWRSSQSHEYGKLIRKNGERWRR